MAKYITDLSVSTLSDEEKSLRETGFTKINVNLNEGQNANSVFLWYKKGDRAPITGVQVSFNDQMMGGLKVANYKMINKDLNAGSTGKPIYMWYSTTEDNNPPIVDVNVTTDPSGEINHLKSGGVWEQVSCNLNYGVEGKYVYAWVRREKPIYICDVTVTDTYDQDKDLFSKGYTRVDVNTNMGAPGGAEVFIWYKKTTNEEDSLSALDISTTPEEYAQIQKDNFTSVNINLNENTTGNDLYLWSKKENPTKIRALVLLLNMEAVKAYKAEVQVGVKVIEKSLNTGNSGAKIYMCYI